MRAVFALCILALVGAQVALAGEIYYQSYQTDFVNTPSNFFCMGNATTTSQNATGGACNSLDNNATSYSLFCDGGNAVIRIDYSYGYCGTSNATSMSRTPTQCGAGSTSGMWKCSGTDSLPTGLAWPPTGQWSVSSKQWNNTFDGTITSPSAGACGTLPASAKAVTTQSASYAGCKNVQPTTYTQKTSAQTFTGGYVGTYSDWDCKTLATLAQPFGTATCDKGVTSSGVPDGNPPPSTPTNTNNVLASRTFYSKSGDNYCGTKISTTYYTNACLNSNKVECVNGTQYYESNYGSTINDGLCTGTPSMTWRNTSSAYCMQNGASDYGFSYSCSGDSSNTPGSASTASFSVVALVIAAFVALLAQ